MGRLLIIFAHFFAIGFLAFGCGRKSSSENADSKINQATRKIDEGRFDEAIELAEEMVQSDGSNRSRMTLASAYAGRAGIQVEKLWSFVVGFNGLVEETGERLQVDIVSLQKAPQQSKNSEELISKVKENLKVLQMIRDRVVKIPYVERNRRSDLIKAVQVLKTADSPGAKLYRSLLLIVIIRSQIEDSQKSLQIDNWEKFVCSSQIALISEHITSTVQYVIEMVLDLTLAFPSGMKDISAQKMQLENAKVKLQSYQLHRNVQWIRSQVCQ